MTTNGNRRGVTEELRRGRQEAKGIAAEIGEIAADFQTLLRQEVQLARAEAQQQVLLGVRALAWGGSAAMFGFVMLIFLFVGAMLALDLVLDLWIAAFITAGIALVLALAAALLAYVRVRRLGPPKKTIESVKEGVEWAQTQLSSNAR